MTGDLPGFFFNPANPAGLKLRKSNVTIEIKPKNPDGDPFGHRLKIQVRISQKFRLNASDHALIKGVIKGKFESTEDLPFDLPLLQAGEKIVGKSGSIKKSFLYSAEWLPIQIHSILHELPTQMWASFIQTLSTLRWYEGEQIQTPKSSDFLVWWRYHQSANFVPVPRYKNKHTFRALGGFAWTLEDQTRFAALSKHPYHEPLGQELRNEASLIAHTAPRSALLLCAAALEAGIKEHIIRVAPSTEWLAMNSPSPPISRILRNYLPVLYEDNPRSPQWARLKPVFKACDALFENRNKLAHTGVHPAAVDLTAYLRAVSDILYILDYLAGHDWALDLIEPTTRRLLGWPVPKNARRFLSITVTH